MKIIEDVKTKVKKIYFTTSVAIVLFIIIAGCVSTQPHTTPVQTTSQITPTPTPATSSPPPQEKLPGKTLRPITLVSAEQSGCFKIKDVGCSPAGPAFTVTLNASSTDVPVIYLSAKLMLTESIGPPPYNRTNYSISFTFPNLNQSNPLMPNQTRRHQVQSAR